MSRGPRIRPGWYLLLALVLYAVIVTALWRGSQGDVHRLQAQQAANASGGTPSAQATATQAAPVLAPSGTSKAASGATAPAGLWFPLPGASVPKDANDLPGAARPYRHGVSQGFDFVDGDAGIPVTYGQPVIASAAGEIVRADTNYVEMSKDQWDQLLSQVGAGGADASQLDQLRGRQVWERLPDGRVLRYGFLSGVRDGIQKGIQVYRGEVIGYVGNSGTGDGVAQTTLHPRLHFEIWQGDHFFGEGLKPDEVRMKAASLFVGP
ncbi:MAG: M23 family metallopeptidase [Deinococcales bacterium]